MAKNQLLHLNDHLFMQIERMDGDGMTPEQIKSEVARSGAMVSLADQIVSIHRLKLDTAKLLYEAGAEIKPEHFALEGPKP